MKTTKLNMVPNEESRHATKIYKDSDSDKICYKWDIMWTTVAKLAVAHILTLYGLFLIFTFQVSWQIILFEYIYSYYGGLGITAGVHRLWTHRAYKANIPLRVFLMVGQTSTLQKCITDWVRDHRVHHKFSDSDADPHNAQRGLFFSQIGWLMLKKHADVLRKGKTIDMSDVIADPVVQFQKKYYGWMAMFLTVVFPVLIPWYFWGDSLWYSFVLSITRLTLNIHTTSTVNSLAHAFGMKPFDKTIRPAENRFVSFITLGEGWHNYHHAFPWDYRAAEWGGYELNLTTLFLDFMDKIGWATDLKFASEQLITQRVLRTGDGTHKSVLSHGHQDPSENIWGWGDKDMKSEEMLKIENISRL